MSDQIWDESPAAEQTEAAGLLAQAYREHQTAGTDVCLYYLDPTTGALHERALRDLPRQGKPIGVITFGFKKRLNDELGHEKVDDVFRDLACELHDRLGLQLVTKVGGDLALPECDESELQGVVAHLQARFPDLPLAGTTVEWRSSEPWEATRHRINDTLGGYTEKLRAEGRFPSREAPLPEGADFSTVGKKIERATIPEPLRKAFRRLSAYEAGMEAYTEPSGVLNKAGWDELRARRPKEYVASADLRAVRAMDRTFGHVNTDRLLEAVSVWAARRGGHRFDFSHVSGDEFRAQCDDQAALRGFMAGLQRELANLQSLLFQGPGGRILEQQGLHLAFGVGGGRNAEAEADQVQLKAAKEQDPRGTGWFAGQSVVHEPGTPGHRRAAERLEDLERAAAEERERRRVSAARSGVPGRDRDRVSGVALPPAQGELKQDLEELRWCRPLRRIVVAQKVFEQGRGLVDRRKGRASGKQPRTPVPVVRFKKARDSGEKER